MRLALFQHREPVDLLIPCKSRLRAWAFENAIMLVIVFGLSMINIVVSVILYFLAVSQHV